MPSSDTFPKAQAVSLKRRLLHLSDYQALQLLSDIPTNHSARELWYASKPTRTRASVTPAHKPSMSPLHHEGLDCDWIHSPYIGMSLHSASQSVPLTDCLEVLPNGFWGELYVTPTIPDIFSFVFSRHSYDSRRQSIQITLPTYSCSMHPFPLLFQLENVPPTNTLLFPKPDAPRAHKCIFLDILDTTNITHHAIHMNIPCSIHISPLMQYSTVK